MLYKSDLDSSSKHCSCFWYCLSFCFGQDTELHWDSSPIDTSNLSCSSWVVIPDSCLIISAVEKAQSGPGVSSQQLCSTERLCGCYWGLSTLVLQIGSWRQELFMLSVATESKSFMWTQLNFLDELSVSVELGFDFNFPWVTNNTTLSQSLLLAG